LLRAEDELDVDGTLYTAVDDGDYENQAGQCASDGNSLCIGVGFFFIDPMINAAKANPGTNFAVLDTVVEDPPLNFRSIGFSEEESGYLAGTLAGMMTASHTIGAVGGIPVPAVVNFVEGYRNAAQCLDPDALVLITYADSFADPEQGADIAEAQMDQGADLIFAAAGGTGVGALKYATQHGAFAIGVDVDEYLSTFEEGEVSGANLLLTSAMKRLDNGVYFTISDMIQGGFTSGHVRYSLADGGVGLAPYHETEALVTQQMRGVLERVERGLMAGLIDPLGECPASLPAYVFMPNAMRAPGP
jgi:basic membrane protein A